jgi:hypothetical protein
MKPAEFDDIEVPFAAPMTNEEIAITLYRYLCCVLKPSPTPAQIAKPRPGSHQNLNKCQSSRLQDFR